MPLTLPYTIANGQAIDATPVMANFNALAALTPIGAAVAAASGANADITSLSALSTPLTTAQGGTGINIATTPLPTALGGTGANIATTPIPVAQGGTGDTGTAWTVASGITLVSSSGTLTTGSVVLHYKILGKTVFLTFAITVTTPGTAAGYLTVGNLPWTWKTAAALAGVLTSNGSALVAGGSAGGNALNCFLYSGATFISAGAVGTFSGSAELT